MRIALATAAGAAALFMHPALALAQDASAPPPEATSPAPAPAPMASEHSDSTSFRGIRIEGNLGGDRFNAQGGHSTEFAYGATVGFDGQIGQHIVIGAEGSWYHADGEENGICTNYVTNAVCQASFREWGAAVRAGYLVTPDLLIFGKGGFVNNEQHIHTYAADLSSRYYKEYTDGYQIGAGVEYSMSVMKFPIYLNAQYVYSQYDNNTSREKFMAGVGFRFK
jgi:outer membrane immunogenic protein